MKNLKLFLFTLIAVLVVGFAVNVNADEPTSVTTFEELKALEDVGGVAQLDADITMTNDVRFRQDLVLDLNGHTLSTNTGMTLIVLSNVTFKDSGSTGKITNGNLEGDYVSKTDWQSIQVGSNNNAIGNLTIESGTYEAKYLIHGVNGKLVINGGSFKATSQYVIGNSSDGAFEAEINGGEFNYTGHYQVINSNGAKITLNDGNLVSDAYGIVAFKDSDITINGGTIEAYDFALSGNGSPAGADNDGTNAKFTITGGVLKSINAAGIYAPQINGVTKITGGTIEGLESAIEIRAGKLTISDGVFKASTDHNGVDPNGNGSTTFGVAVAIAQHTTKEPIDVTISGGTFNAYIALKESNPQQNPYEDISKVKVTVTGGTFNATSDQSVYSEDLAGFISGGTYNVSPDNVYVTKGFHIFNDAGIYVVRSNDISKAIVSGIKTQTYNGKEQRQTSLVVKLNGVTLVKDVDYTVGYSSLVNAGTNIKMTIKGKGDYEGSLVKTFTRNKAKNPLTVKAYNKTVYYSKVRKASQVVKPITIVKKQGTLTYTKLSGSSTKLLLNKTTGKVTVKKGTKKGKYKIRIKIYASGNVNYKSNYGIRTIYVTVK